ncbi:MAG: TetR/AcrR family transcriptional regulator [Isosphaeraceae bacterium]
MSRSGRVPRPAGSSEAASTGAATVALREEARHRGGRDLRARREEILDAATELFAEHGFSDAVTQALVDRLGVGKGTLYRHFRCKRDLFLASVDRVMHRLREHIDGELAGVDDDLERLAIAVAAFLRFFELHPKFAELVIQERALFKDREKLTVAEHREVTRARWREVFRSLIAAGRLRDIPAERITDVAGNLLYGTMFTNYSVGHSRPADEQARDIVDVLFLGLLSDSERRKRAASPGGLLGRPGRKPR